MEHFNRAKIMKWPSTLYLVINITVCEHSVEILHAFTSCPVVIILKSLLDRPHVHWVLDDFVIVLKNKTHLYIKE